MAIGSNRECPEDNGGIDNEREQYFFQTRKARSVDSGSIDLREGQDFGNASQDNVEASSSSTI